MSAMSEGLAAQVRQAVATKAAAAARVASAQRELNDATLAAQQAGDALTNAETALIVALHQGTA